MDEIGNITDNINEDLDCLFEGKIGQKTEVGNVPNINDLNEFLSPSDVQDGDLIMFTNAGEFKEKEFRGEKKKVFEVEIELPDGNAKKATLNRTSRNAIAASYSPDTETWVGKKAKVQVLSQNVGGQMKKVIYLTPVE